MSIPSRRPNLKNLRRTRRKNANYRYIHRRIVSSYGTAGDTCSLP